MAARITPHGSKRGEYVAARGRNLTSKLHGKPSGVEVNRYRKFGDQVFHLQTIKPSMREANWFVSEYKENFYIRKWRIPGNRGYAIYVRSKSSRRGQA
jgi:hypothetical protein